jgi:predicted deacetylase
MSTVAVPQFLPVVATSAQVTDSLVVSLHDIAPSTQQTVDTMLQEIARRGVRFCSLLVVPDYHHEGVAMKNRQFVSWLRDLESQGHEIVIHGYFHVRPRREGETPRDRLITRSYTRDEGEFYDLDYDEALRRITAARDQFRAAGLKPRGFVAPAWLLNAESERAARDAEMEYTTRLRTIRDLRSGQDFPARSLVYSVENRWRRAVSLAWNAALARLLKASPLLRLCLHPPDYSHPAIWQQIIDLLRALDRVRTPTTCKDWIAEQRLRRGL